MFSYPALYTSAGQLSAASQTRYLRLILGEYGLLLLASILSLDLDESSLYYIAYAFVFLASLATLVTRNWQKPEQDWYKGRALAESIKTSCWRYCMRAEPFGDADNIVQRRAEFRNHLRAILEANRHIGDRIPPDAAANDQITVSMEETRALSLQGRKDFYDRNRIREQRSWYQSKAIANKKASRHWMIGGVVAYAIAIFLVLLRIVHPEQKIWPIDPLIVVASSIIGWTQVKKFNELASSYTLTAHEIGIIQGRVQEVDTEADFSDFINDAEQAFSREHTQWVARQQSQ
ncbi:MAG: DUF4231 domain-containing protein [Acetobacter fabarum]|uniref:DUF4231 domain-containing protein n=1 Tax=Acetobacter fabarum TaxID=483199 RepID=UPI00242E9D67|nr:DUF4231 domain-containing protein [Acetobacter fabarum]MCH4024757.1 DUF4231 domain-containing protein [Acetobacter fabarum]MCH4084801.1 DUF4231 domain-containing protein [Acetobacter fabarum]MCH4137956.1 DUF4231 domain-containing protein [Acetobacter fabarum]